MGDFKNNKEKDMRKNSEDDADCELYPPSVLTTTLTNLNVANIEGSQEKEKFLGSSYKPKQADVICGIRGTSPAYRHSGNEIFRGEIEDCLSKYEKSSTRTDKSDIVKEIVRSVRSRGGGFIKEQGSELSRDRHWIDLGNKVARDKVGHAIRAALLRRGRGVPQSKSTAGTEMTIAKQYSSSSKAHEESSEEEPRKKRRKGNCYTSGTSHADNEEKDEFVSLIKTSIMPPSNEQALAFESAIRSHEKAHSFGG